MRALLNAAIVCCFIQESITSVVLNRPYQYTLEAINDVIDGVVEDNALLDSLIPFNAESPVVRNQGGLDDVVDEYYLRVKIEECQGAKCKTPTTTLPYAYTQAAGGIGHVTGLILTSETTPMSHNGNDNPQKTLRNQQQVQDTPNLVHANPKRNAEIRTLKYIPSLLMSNKTAFSINTNAFTVNDKGYIAVEDQSEFKGLKFIEFNVEVVNEKDDVVSNRLAFVVYIKQEVINYSSYPVVPAVLAGVLVLLVVFIALLIPLVTRAKRRYKQGKPMFKLGSHKLSTDVNNEDKKDMERKSLEPSWYGNNTVFTYEQQVEQEKSNLSKELQRRYSASHDPPNLQMPTLDPLATDNTNQKVSEDYMNPKFTPLCTVRNEVVTECEEYAPNVYRNESYNEKL